MSDSPITTITTQHLHEVDSAGFGPLFLVVLGVVVVAAIVSVDRSRPRKVFGSKSEMSTFYSPLPMAEVRSLINKRCINAYLGAVLAILGAVDPAASVSDDEENVGEPRRTTGIQLFGKVRNRRVRLQAPYAFNNREPRLVGTLEEASDGGTFLRAHYEMSAGTWSRSASYNAQQMRHIVQTLATTANLVPLDDEPI